jgi:hypothetical protein
MGPVSRVTPVHTALRNCMRDEGRSFEVVNQVRLPKRHPACRRREAQSGSWTEREKLAGDAKGKGASGSNREAESTDAPDWGGLPCSSVEAG